MVLVIEDRGLAPSRSPPMARETTSTPKDLAAYLARRERCDARARWRRLRPAYRGVAASLAPRITQEGPRCRPRHGISLDISGGVLVIDGNQRGGPDGKIGAAPSWAAQRLPLRLSGG